MRETPRRPGPLARALLFNLAFYAATAVLGVLYLPFLALPGRWMHHGTRFWIRLTFALLRVVVGLDWRVRGAENRPAGPAVYACKHQSAWETMVFYLLFDDPAYVMKRELFRIPFYGWYTRKARSIGVDRGAGAAALRSLLRGAEAALAEGRSIVIFPEGTRTPPGEGRPPQPGVAALYQRLPVPLVPVALNSGLFWPRRRFGKWPGTITLEFLPAIEPGLERKEFARRLEDALNSASRRLEREAGFRPPAGEDAPAAGAGSSP
ncbi:MAG: 1-acyl-sn-glycerol-3-phosphate acyltransferase [Proteobacteria bacterium]|nr:1-acyl-sn-glycerol-3-phosphate acyltransferase [Pseudomonadota bacterium]